MKKLQTPILIIAILFTSIILAKNYNKLPKGWHQAGNDPNGYAMGLDTSNSESGHSCAYIKSKNPKINKFGTLMQSISANNYLGKRIQLSGYIKSKGVKDRSEMWMRIDGSNMKELGFDNMYDRPIRGTTGWKQYKIVLDVPQNSKSINYGVILSGQGEVWIDNIQLIEVDKNVPVTNILKENKLPNNPINLNFEK